MREVGPDVIEGKDGGDFRSADPLGRSAQSEGELAPTNRVEARRPGAFNRTFEGQPQWGKGASTLNGLHVRDASRAIEQRASERVVAQKVREHHLKVAIAATPGTIGPARAPSIYDEGEGEGVDRSRRKGMNRTNTLAVLDESKTIGLLIVASEGSSEERRARSRFRNEVVPLLARRNSGRGLRGG